MSLYSVPTADLDSTVYEHYNENQPLKCYAGLTVFNCAIANAPKLKCYIVEHVKGVGFELCCVCSV